MVKAIKSSNKAVKTTRTTLRPAAWRSLDGIVADEATTEKAAAMRGRAVH